MVRVLKPGGTLVIATWCQREETPDTPFRCAHGGSVHMVHPGGAHVAPWQMRVPQLSMACFPLLNAADAGGAPLLLAAVGTPRVQAPTTTPPHSPPAHPPCPSPSGWPAAARATRSGSRSCTRSGRTPTLCPRRSTAASWRWGRHAVGEAGLHREVSGTGFEVACCPGTPARPLEPSRATTPM